MQINTTTIKKGIVTAGDYYVYIGIALMPTTEKRFIAQNKEQIEIFSKIRTLCDKLVDLDNIK